MRKGIGDEGEEKLRQFTPVKSLSKSQESSSTGLDSPEDTQK